MKLMEGEAGDAFAVHPIVTEVLEESSESMDIIGFNYLTGRHLLEGELHPNKCVLGTETFPADIARLWKVVNSSKRVLGDFTWTGRSRMRDFLLRWKEQLWKQLPGQNRVYRGYRSRRLPETGQFSPGSRVWSAERTLHCSGTRG